MVVFKKNKDSQFKTLHLTLMPYKSIAISLLFTIFFGPIGLLYAAFWGGVSMLFVAVIVLSSHLQGALILFWILCNVWGVAAVRYYNNKIIAARLKIAHEKDNPQAATTT